MQAMHEHPREMARHGGQGERTEARASENDLVAEHQSLSCAITGLITEIESYL